MDVTRERAHRAWRVAERIARLSDNLIPIGRWGIGLDGVIAQSTTAEIIALKIASRFGETVAI